MISALDIIAVTEVLTRIIEIGNFYPKTSLLLWVAYYGKIRNKWHTWNWIKSEFKNKGSLSHEDRDNEDGNDDIFSQIQEGQI